MQRDSNTHRYQGSAPSRTAASGTSQTIRCPSVKSNQGEENPSVESRSGSDMERTTDANPNELDLSERSQVSSLVQVPASKPLLSVR